MLFLIVTLSRLESPIDKHFQHPFTSFPKNAFNFLKGQIPRSKGRGHSFITPILIKHRSYREQHLLKELIYF